MNDHAENLAIAERFYALWDQGGLEGVRPLMHDQVEWQPHPQAPEPGPFRGPDEVIRVANSYTRGFGKYRPVPHRILPGAEPEVVVGLATYTTVGREGGQEFTMPVGHLLNIRDGLISRFEEIPDQLEALIAGGADPSEEAPTRTEGIALTLITALNEGDLDLARAMIARGAEVDAPCGPADWDGVRVADAELQVDGDDVVVTATVTRGDDPGRRLAVRIEPDFMGLIRRLVAEERPG